MPATILATRVNSGRRRTYGQRHLCVERAITFAQKHGINTRIPTDIAALKIYAMAENLGDTSPERLRKLIESEAYFDMAAFSG